MRGPLEPLMDRNRNALLRFAQRTDVQSVGRVETYSPGMESVLVVDDDRGVRELLRRWGAGAGLDVRAAADAEQGLAAMRADPAAVAVCDIGLPAQSGLWLAQQLNHEFPDTAVVIITGGGGLDPVIASLRIGVTDFLAKPLGRGPFVDTVRRALDAQRAAVRIRTLGANLCACQARLAEAIIDCKMTATRVPELFLSLLSVHQPHADDHARRVATLSVDLAMSCGLAEPELSQVEQAGLLHDLGKIAVPQTILAKPTPLTREERRLLGGHVETGFDLLQKVPCLASAAEIVLGIEERYDGGGYPGGVMGPNIPLGSRIIIVANAYDSLTHVQPYRRGFPIQEALRKITDRRGTQFDPQIVDALFSLAASHPIASCIGT